MIKAHLHVRNRKGAFHLAPYLVNHKHEFGYWQVVMEKRIFVKLRSQLNQLLRKMIQ